MATYMGGPHRPPRQPYTQHKLKTNTGFGPVRIVHVYATTQALQVPAELELWDAEELVAHVLPADDDYG